MLDRSPYVGQNYGYWMMMISISAGEMDTERLGGARPYESQRVIEKRKVLISVTHAPDVACK